MDRTQAQKPLVETGPGPAGHHTEQSLEQGLVRPSSQGACIVIMGVTASGKSTTARFLSEKIGFSFQDADVYHPEENMRTMQSGQSLSDEQRARFVSILIAEIAKRTGNGENIVLAWSALKEIHRENFSREVTQSSFVFLEIDEEEAISRATTRLETDTTAVDPKIVKGQFLALERPGEGLVVNATQSIQDILSIIVSSSEVQALREGIVPIDQAH